MTNVSEKNQIFRCNICGNIVETVNVGGAELVCCGQPMEFLVAKTEDQGMEKHIPVVEKIENGILVKIGEMAHPMQQQHYIQWIEILLKNGESCRKYLNHGDAPEAIFKIDESQIEGVREYCNVHGLWKK
ncbi:MAG: Desulfoferrodoxin [Candidatus Moranbacteria bacterium GW2011_GWE2_35_2-]|nr:MAG: Desulfoferrodoxin [Candidatus Moranbacteria bacterium GW2011_GWE2_35_2-]KKQ06759.1 MAG: Desulfoferrodoxin [Candidatus Moranbacteria bacterium GW2011_GWF1_36_4]KKQ22492.1 MAG: Desulfoferrodoxin [Candidatus Moranbacteria bacterium GW2011_GWF2_37_11]KKQ29561.1 MAG: Desulfoferrodoxin [Candidatus Moranbacteria bacterium GW2011_GWD1_37_17]KKQ30568.1 MAG: Desulfoferrodoxin [Candidatus Moranbacteria bacterium GW2011_GWE1_37_24]KKQ48207.1 MAG: Desulfoferrodoxin [Candidatus Moranbacteria bacteri